VQWHVKRSAQIYSGEVTMNLLTVILVIASTMSLIRRHDPPLVAATPEQSDLQDQTNLGTLVKQYVFQIICQSNPSCYFFEGTGTGVVVPFKSLQKTDIVRPARKAGIANLFFFISPSKSRTDSEKSCPMMLQAPSRIRNRRHLQNR
jgi:hypothetical protein